MIVVRAVEAEQLMENAAQSGAAAAAACKVLRQ